MSAWAMASPAAEAAAEAAPEAALEAALATASPVLEPHAVRPAVPATATPATIRLSRRDQHEHVADEVSASVVPGADGSVGCSVLIVVLAVIGVPVRAGTHDYPHGCCGWPMGPSDSGRSFPRARARAVGPPGNESAPEVTSRHHSAVNAGRPPN